MDVYAAIVNANNTTLILIIPTQVAALLCSISKPVLVGEGRDGGGGGGVVVVMLPLLLLAIPMPLAISLPISSVGCASAGGLVFVVSGGPLSGELAGLAV